MSHHHPYGGYDHRPPPSRASDYQGQPPARGGSAPMRGNPPYPPPTDFGRLAGPPPHYEDPYSPGGYSNGTLGRPSAQYEQPPPPSVRPDVPPSFAPPPPALYDRPPPPLSPYDQRFPPPPAPGSAYDASYPPSELPGPTGALPPYSSAPLGPPGFGGGPSQQDRHVYTPPLPPASSHMPMARRGGVPPPPQSFSSGPPPPPEPWQSSFAHQPPPADERGFPSRYKDPNASWSLNERGRYQDPYSGAPPARRRSRSPGYSSERRFSGGRERRDHAGEEAYRPFEDARPPYRGGSFDRPDYFEGGRQDYPPRDGRRDEHRQKAERDYPRERYEDRETSTDHVALIEERIARERPCRTLFIRNIMYETPSPEMRAMFEQYGEIKTFFDLIAKRGMVFVTFYDLRAAELARERLQGAEVGGRPIDVHFSLPREEEQKQRCDREKNQGTLFLALRDSAARSPIPEEGLRRQFGQYGDIKSIRVYKDHPNQRFIEFWDSRACELAHDREQNQLFADGRWDIKFAWDMPVSERGSNTDPAHRFRDDRRPTRGGRPVGPPERRPESESRYEGAYYDARYEDERRRPPPPAPAAWQDRARPPLPYEAGPAREGHARDPRGAPPPARAEINAGEDRLAQAQKVQQLLSALQQPPAAANASGPPAHAPAQAPAQVPAQVPAPAQAALPARPAPVPGPPAGAPPSQARGGVPQAKAAASTVPPPAPAGAGGLPAHIAALLAQASKNSV